MLFVLIAYTCTPQTGIEHIVLQILKLNGVFLRLKWVFRGGNGGFKPYRFAKPIRFLYNVVRMTMNN